MYSLKKILKFQNFSIVIKFDVDIIKLKIDALIKAGTGNKFILSSKDVNSFFNVEKNFSRYVLEFDDFYKELKNNLEAYLSLVTSEFGMKFDKDITIFFYPSYLNISWHCDDEIHYGKINKYPDFINIMYHILCINNKVLCINNKDGDLNVLTELILYDFILLDKMKYYKKQDCICKELHILQKKIISKNYKHKKNFKDIIKNEKKDDEKIYFSKNLLGNTGKHKSILIDSKTKKVLTIDSELYGKLRFGVKKDLFLMLRDSYDYLDELVKLKLVDTTTVKYDPDISMFPSINPRIKLLGIEIINVCNYQCKHCYFYNKKFREQNKAKRVLSIADVENLVKFLRKYDLQYINIQGGEPLLAGLDYFIKLFECLSKYRYIKKYVIHTNLSVMDNAYLYLFEKYKEYITIRITFHSADEKENDIISGFDGDFKNKLKWIKEFENHGIEVKVNSVLSKHNYKNIDKVYNFCKTNDIKYIGIDSARVSDTNSDLLDCDYDFKRTGVYIIPSLTFKYIKPDGWDLLSLKNKEHCWASSISLDYDSKIYVCGERHTEDTFLGTCKNCLENEETFIDKYEELIVKQTDENKCNECEFRIICRKCVSVFKNKHSYGFESICSYEP